jgi:hypothetical protein
MSHRSSLVLKHNDIQEALRLANRQYIVLDVKHTNNLRLLDDETADQLISFHIKHLYIATVGSQSEAFSPQAGRHTEDSDVVFMEHLCLVVMLCVVDRDHALC